MGLQKFKMSIANTVISQDNASMQSMGTEQLLDLFTLDKVSRAASNRTNNTAVNDALTYLRSPLRARRGRGGIARHPPQPRPP